jgi:hypothetical protein
MTTLSRGRLGTALVHAVQCHGSITADRLHWGSRNALCGTPVCSRFCLFQVRMIVQRYHAYYVQGALNVNQYLTAYSRKGWNQDR